MTEASDYLYPNRGEDPPEPGVSRRRLLSGTATVGAAATAGCLGDGDTSGEPTTDRTTATATDGGPDIVERDTVFAFNTDDGTMSAIDVGDDAVAATFDLGITASFPANQFAPSLTTAPDDSLWLNVGQGVRAVAVGALSTAAAVETGSGANWQELTPDGAHLLVSARDAAHTNVRIDAGPASDSFGEVTGEIDRTDEGGAGDRSGPGPCDVTVHPDGEYAYVPDIWGDTLTVLDVAEFGIATQIEVDPATDADHARPWMGTAAPDGETLLVEHDEGDGVESVWDVSTPAEPKLVTPVTTDDGLGQRPLTSEIGPDSETSYVFTPGSESVTVLDLGAGEVREQIDLGGTAFTGTWDPDHEKLYVPVQTNDEVAVIDHAAGEITTRIDVGAAPYGATAAAIRPAAGTTPDTQSALAEFGLTAGEGTTYCIGNCACGHEL